MPRFFTSVFHLFLAASRQTAVAPLCLLPSRFLALSLDCKLYSRLPARQAPSATHCASLPQRLLRLRLRLLLRAVATDSSSSSSSSANSSSVAVAVSCRSLISFMLMAIANHLQWVVENYFETKSICKIQKYFDTGRAVKVSENIYNIRTDL